MRKRDPEAPLGLARVWGMHWLCRMVHTMTFDLCTARDGRFSN
jgi:hypothetical protein